MATEKLPHPFLTIDGINNFRDMGGYPVQTADGAPKRIVRPLVLYRSGDPCRAPLESVKKLQEEGGIATVYDLRSMDGILGSGGGEVVLRGFNQKRNEAGVDRIWAPVIDDDKTTPELVAQRLMAFMVEGPEGYVDQFMGYLNNGYPSFHRIILHLASLNPPPPNPQSLSREPEPQAILFHCSSGNNRTGALGGLLLYLLGVPKPLIAEEYGLGNLGSMKTRAGMQSRLKVRILAGGGFGGDETKITQDMLDRMTSSNPHNMVAFLDAIDKQWGGPEEYVKSVLRLTDEDIARYRDSMTVEAGK